MNLHYAHCFTRKRIKFINFQTVLLVGHWTHGRTGKPALLFIRFHKFWQWNNHETRSHFLQRMYSIRLILQKTVKYTFILQQTVTCNATNITAKKNKTSHRYCRAKCIRTERTYPSFKLSLPANCTRLH